MPRPRKYANGAERVAAHRERKKLEEQAKQPDLNELARIIHRVYKKRAKEGHQDYAHLVGKTPFETLMRSVLYDALFGKANEFGVIEEFPGWDKVIVPLEKAGKDDFGYLVNGTVSHPRIVMFTPENKEYFDLDNLEDESTES